MKRIALPLLMMLLGWGESLCGQPMIDWAMGTGGTGIDEGNAIAVDGARNIYVAGDFNGSMDFDPGPGIHSLSSTGTDMVVGKYDPSGNLLWAHRIGGPGIDLASGIALDDSGNVFVAGHFEQTADFDPGTLAFLLTSNGGKDFALVKLDTYGNFKWAKQFGSPNHEQRPKIVLDGLGNIHLAGSFKGTMDCDPGIATSNLVSDGGSMDAFVVKLARDGSLIWAENWGGAGEDLLQGIALDTMGHIFTTGTFDDIADLDPGQNAYFLYPDGPYKDVFVSRLDSAGAFDWGFSVGGSSGDDAYAITCDPIDGVIVSGHFKGTVDFDPGPGTANYTALFGNEDQFLLKVNAQGAFVWLQQLSNAGGYSTIVGNALLTDSVGNLYLAGTYTGNIDFDPGPGTQVLISFNSYDIFLLMLNPSGGLMWVGATESYMSPDKAFGIAVDHAGKICLTGYYGGNSDFDLGTGTYQLQTANNFDFFIAKYGFCQPTDTNLVAHACSSFTLNSQTYTSSGTYFQVLTNAGGCDSTLQLQLTITGGTAPGQPTAILGDTAVCAGSYYAYTLPSVSGATSYAWTLPGGWTGASVTDTLLALADTNGGVISVMAQNACGSSPVQTLMVSVVAAPTLAGAINGPTTLCEASAQTYAVGAVPGALGYVWSLPGGWTGSSTSDTLSAVAGVVSGTISVYAFNACGNSAPLTAQVTVFTTPQPQFSSTTNGLTATFTDLTVGGNAWSWDFGDGGSSNLQNPVHPYAAAGVYLVSLTVAANGCTGTYVDTLTVLGVGAATANDARILVFPNPSSGLFSVVAPVGLDGRLFNVHGQLVAEVVLNPGVNALDLRNLGDGIYYLQLYDGELGIRRMLVKQ